jgi:hypothetical protein
LVCPPLCNETWVYGSVDTVAAVEAKTWLINEGQRRDSGLSCPKLPDHQNASKLAVRMCAPSIRVHPAVIDIDRCESR